MPYFKNEEGYNLYYEDINGEMKNDTQGTIILIHGFASSASFFKGQIKVLKNNFRIIAFDALGHGRSDHPKHLNLSKNLRYDIIRDLEDLLEFLEVEEKYGIIGLALFIGVPLPGSGVYSGALGAYLLGFNFKDYFKAAVLGVLIAATIVTIVSIFGNGLIANLFLKV